MEPPASQAGGRSVCPISVRTRSRGTPRASAAIWARDGAGAGADVGGVGPDDEGAVGQGPGGRGGGDGRGGVGGSGDAGAEEQRALAADAGARVAAVPAEAAGALAQALHEVPAAERLAAARLPVGFVAQAQLDGVQAERVGEFVHGRLQGVHAGRLAGGAHPGGAGHVQRDHAVGAEQGGVAYVTREGTAACSTNSRTREVWVVASCRTAVSLPSAWAPRRSRWRVGARWPTVVGRYRRG